MSDLVKHANKKEVEGLIKEYDMVVVDFWAEWCPPCRKMGPIFEKIAGKYDGVLFLKVNTDENPDMAYNLNISSIPTFIIFKGGKEFTRVIGAAPDKLEKAISQALN
ncbi:MAG: thioredoxin [Candidatus Hodarchaeota archaeon]